MQNNCETVLRHLGIVTRKSLHKIFDHGGTYICYFFETFKWHHAMYAENVGTYISQMLPHAFQKTNLKKHLSLHARTCLFCVDEIPKLNENMCFQQMLRTKTKNLDMEN